MGLWPACNAEARELSPESSGTDGAAELVIVGIVLCEVAVVMIALGSDLQRYAFTRVDPASRCIGHFTCRRAPVLAVPLQLQVV